MVLLAHDTLYTTRSPEDNSSGGLSADSILQSVDAVAVSDLPLVWQQIAEEGTKVGHSDPDLLVALARLFYTKATDRSAEVFQQEGLQQSADFQSFYLQGARKTLEYFGRDFAQSAYPDFDLALETARAKDGAERVVSFVRAVFDDLRYDLPASFYRMLLCPIERDSIHEARPMFFDPQMQGVKRAYDACLHGFNVTAVLMQVQAYASEQGLLVQHGCGCDHSLSQVIPGKEKISFEFESEKGRKKALTAYVWRCWNEYLLFPLGVHAKTLAL